MNKIILSLAINVLVIFGLHGQNWVSQEAVWHYDFSGWGMGFYKIHLGNDTLIQNKMCQKFMGKKYTFWPQPGGYYTQGAVLDIEPEYTYTSGDTVFYFENNKFFVLFNFNATIGDQWVISDEQLIGLPGYDSLSMVRVVNTDSVLINGITRKALRIQTIIGSPKGLDGWVVEGIGPIANYLFPTYRNSDSTMIDFEMYVFKCYQDSTVGLYNPNGIECEYLLNHLGLQESERNFITIYPNPTKDYCWIENNYSGKMHLELFDCWGRKLVHEVAQERRIKIDLAKYPKGLYFVQVGLGNQSISKKLIKH